MNEFEVAELALMQKSYALELEMVTQGYVQTLQTEATILLSLIFGYLIVAHLIGDSLTRRQVTIFNSLYLFTVCSDLGVYKSHYDAIAYSAGRMVEKGDFDIEHLAIAGTPDGVKIVVAAYILMIIASLYFMWSVRHQDPREKPRRVVDLEQAVKSGKPNV